MQEFIQVKADQELTTEDTGYKQRLNRDIDLNQEVTPVTLKLTERNKNLINKAMDKKRATSQREKLIRKAYHEVFNGEKIVTKNGITIQLSPSENKSQHVVHMAMGNRSNLEYLLNMKEILKNAILIDSDVNLSIKGNPNTKVDSHVFVSEVHGVDNEPRVVAIRVIGRLNTTSREVSYVAYDVYDVFNKQIKKRQVNGLGEATQPSPPKNVDVKGSLSQKNVPVKRTLRNLLEESGIRDYHNKKQGIIGRPYVKNGVGNVKSEDYFDNHPYVEKAFPERENAKAFAKWYGENKEQLYKEGKLPKGVTFMQEQDTHVAGLIRMAEGLQSVIKLSKEHADASTLMHEMAHLHFQMLHELASHKNATEQMQKDWAYVAKWTGWKEGQEVPLVLYFVFALTLWIESQYYEDRFRAC